MIFFSVVTINLNNSKGLEESIQSVMKQERSIVEHIIIDGNSVDSSIQILDKYASKLSYSISERDSGIYDAMNKGIKVAKGKYVFFLNSGDTFVNENVLNEVKAKDPKSPIFYGDVNLVYKSKKLRKCHPIQGVLKYLSFEMICHQSIFFCKNLLDKYNGFSLEYKYCSDYEFLLRSCFDPLVSFEKIDTVVANFNMDGISNSDLASQIIGREKSMIWSKYVSSEIQLLLDEKKKKSFNFLFFAQDLFRNLLKHKLRRI